MSERSVHGVVFKDRPSGQYVAVCLEYGVVTHGNTEEHAFEMLREAVELHLETAPPLEDDSEYQPVDSEPAIRTIRVNAPAIQPAA